MEVTLKIKTVKESDNFPNLCRHKRRSKSVRNGRENDRLQVAKRLRKRLRGRQTVREERDHSYEHMNVKACH